MECFYSLLTLGRRPRSFSRRPVSTHDGPFRRTNHDFQSLHGWNQSAPCPPGPGLNSECILNQRDPCCWIAGGESSIVMRGRSGLGRLEMDGPHKHGHKSTRLPPIWRPSFHQRCADVSFFLTNVASLSDLQTPQGRHQYVYQVSLRFQGQRGDKRLVGM